MAEFSWIEALAGGCLIGFAAVMMMGGIGRIAGISGIFSATLNFFSALPWQFAFIAGLLFSGLVWHWLIQPITLEINTPWYWLASAGLLVGIGSRLGSGCTSGHGVCGMARLSPRSIAATVTFIGTGMLTVYLMKLL